MPTTTTKTKGHAPAKSATPTSTGEHHTSGKNSAEAQRARLLRALKRGPVDTQRAFRKLDILHPPRRVFELRRMGYAITTQWVERITEAGESHRVGMYVLEGAA
ncbi:hypothetical protein HFK83_01520 [Ralstonia pseudosolanacearum]|uniref:helix-turn-helix domain-containing protein n=1 Tax=Ralstonia solanacearum species complex TaxID=3116862 RepID=UPI0002F0F206|nr:helix-turn-helix domain-containing protein [Ralstonia pseudosolanacearum]MCK4121064.1 hypothetical protein [Ralstonia pseudosolanacearum]